MAKQKNIQDTTSIQTTTDIVNSIDSDFLHRNQTVILAARPIRNEESSLLGHAQVPYRR
jgi:hypothetical protein